MDCPCIHIDACRRAYEAGKNAQNGGE
jgi:hypothetical protein